MSSSFKPRYWNGESWVQEELVPLPNGMKLAGLTAFALALGIPQDAEFCTVTGYEEDGPEPALRWYVPVSEETSS